jgi:hypothetical protein
MVCIEPGWSTLLDVSLTSLDLGIRRWHPLALNLNFQRNSVTHTVLGLGLLFTVGIYILNGKSLVEK